MKKRPYRSYLIGSRPTTKVLIICQSEKVLYLLERSEIFWLRCLSSRLLNRRKTNQDRI